MGTAVEEIIAAVLARTPRPQQPLALCNAGDVLFKNGDLDAGLACFDSALRLDPTCARAWVGRATILHRQGRAEALGCVNRALDADSSFAPALALKGDMLRKRGVREEALVCYEQALNASPELVGPWLSRATVLYELRRMTDAARAVERFLALAPEDHPELLTARMMMAELERTGANVRSADSAPPFEKPTAAAPVVEPPPAAKKKSDRKAEKKSDRKAEKKSLRSEARADQRASRKSLRAMQAVVVAPGLSAAPAKADPGTKGQPTNDDTALLDEIRTLCLANRQVEALRKLEPFVKRCPESREAWVLRAHILYSLKQYEPAYTSIERAIRLDATDVDTAKLAVKLLAAMKKDERALEAADRVLSLAPRDAEAHRARADCLVVLMRQAEAVFSYEKVIHYLPDDGAAWLGLGRTLRQLRRFSEARMALNKAIELASSPEVLAQAKEIMAKLPAT